MHAIDETTGKAAFVERLLESMSRAWHGLGKTVTDALNTESMLNLAILNWLVHLCRNKYTWNGEEKESDTWSVVRSDTGKGLGTVKGRYTPFQNAELAGLLDSFMGQSQAFWATAGSLFDGQKVFMTAILPREVYANVKEDAIVPYVCFTSSHDGSGQIEIFLSLTRIVCANTLAIALGSKSKGLKVKHTKNCKEKVKSWSKELELINKKLDNAQEEINILSNRVVSETETRSYFEELFPTKKPAKVKESTGLLDSILEAQGQGQELVSELLEKDNKRNEKIGALLLENLVRTDNRLSETVTAWDLWNAVSYYTDHQAGTRGSNDTERTHNLVDSIHFGRLDAVKTQAWDNALALAQ
jgi:phage/plasmid-like protein (TIGR03299 family)